MSMGRKKTFVVGWPIAHSRSPLIHGYWLDKYRIDGSYEKLAVAPEHFADLLPSLLAKGYRGGNITLPHKISALNSVDECSPLAQIIGAVNTVSFRDGRIYGSNTDAYGFFKNLTDCAPDWRPKNGPALVLGAGGAALAVIAALLQEGVPRIVLANRSRHKAEAIQKRFGNRIEIIDWDERRRPLPDSALLVNTTSLGMTGKPALHMDISGLSRGALVSDLVYAPLQTPLLEAAAAGGFAVADGLGMLLHQAAPGFEQWFGVMPEVTPELRALVERDLKENP